MMKKLLAVGMAVASFIFAVPAMAQNARIERRADDLWRRPVPALICVRARRRAFPHSQGPARTAGKSRRSKPRQSGWPRGW